MADQLFVYGTLHPDHAPAEIRDVVAQLRFAGVGTIQGRRFELAECPAVLPAKNSVVRGTVFTLPDDSRTLQKLDAYEEYDRDAPERSLFVRRKATVTLADGRRAKCWVYFYNRLVPEQLLKQAS